MKTKESPDDEGEEKAEEPDFTDAEIEDADAALNEYWAEQAERGADDDTPD